MQAWSRATGSKETRIPTSGTRKESLQPQQSHSGVTFMTKLMYAARPSWLFAAPWAYSAILLRKSDVSLFSPILMQVMGQTVAHSPQPMQRETSTFALSPATAMALSGQWAAQVPQPTQSGSETMGWM